jgi:uncharacterized protein with ParB-like and HNH nuclease domain
MSEQLQLFPKYSIDKQMEAEKQLVESQKVVDYQIREYTIELLVKKYQDGRKEGKNDIFIPPYQRKFVWDEKKQSFFIESLLLGMPIPYMFSADSAENDGRSEIVDGSQRLRTLEAFLDNKLVLVDLEKLDLLNGFRFTDLPDSRQRRFKRKTIRLIELTEKADYSVRKQIFSRINTTATLLSEMELRRGVYEGAFADFIQICSENVKFHLLCPVSSKRTLREEYQELVLRFFALGEQLDKFVHSVKGFLNDYAAAKSQQFDAATMEEDFENMLDFINIHFPYGFKKTENHNSTPRIRFEAISVGVHLALQVKPNLIPAQPILNWLESNEFKEHVTSDAANNLSKVIGRIEFVKNKLLTNL